MKNGYTMPYYRYEGGRVVFAKRVGLIPSAQRLDIKKVIKAVPPALVDDGIAHGSRQVFVVFALPGSTGLYATPIGVMEGSQEHYFSDLLFYYDDPHTIYDNWPKDVWTAIDAHQVEARYERARDPHVHRPKDAERRLIRGQPHHHLRSGRQEVDRHLRQQPHHVDQESIASAQENRLLHSLVAAKTKTPMYCATGRNFCPQP